MRTIIISTKTKENTVAFEGIASLCTSKVDGKKREATGYYCDNKQERPTTEETKIPKFFQRQKCGTSIFIMGVRDNKNEQSKCYDEIKKAVASHFWLSILHKKLIVKVGDESIDHDNIIDVATSIFKDLNEESPIPYIKTVCNAESENVDSFKKIVKIVPELGKCLLYVQKNKNGSDVVLNMRKTEMLIYQQSMLKGYGYFGVFVCLGDKGNKILRMAEDPAHKTWNSNNCENDEDISAARKAIQEKNKFIRQEIIDCFGGQNENTSIISDLQNYLYLNISEKELEADRESVYGIHSGEKQKELSGSQIPDLFPDTLPKEIASTSNDINIFYIEENTSDKNEDENNPLEGGHGTGGNGGRGIVQPLPKDKYTHNDDGEEKGTFLKPIKIRACAVYTKKSDGILYHYLRIIPGSNCDNMALDVYAVGDEEDANDEIFIDNYYCPLKLK